MHRWAAIWTALLLALALPGCSDEPKSDGVADSTDDFGDLGVAPTDTRGILVGVVVDEAIRPIAEAKVALNAGGGAPMEKTTDAEGRFAYGDLEPGTYFLSASHL